MLKKKDVVLKWEINEASSVVLLALMKELAIVRLMSMVGMSVSATLRNVHLYVNLSCTGVNSTVQLPFEEF